MCTARDTVCTNNSTNSSSSLAIGVCEDCDYFINLQWWIFVHSGEGIYCKDPVVSYSYTKLLSHCKFMLTWLYITSAKFSLCEHQNFPSTIVIA